MGFFSNIGYGLGVIIFLIVLFMMWFAYRELTTCDRNPGILCKIFGTVV